MSAAQNTETKLDAALRWAARGFPVLPLQPNGKRPATENGLDDATTDPDTIRAIWTDPLTGLPLDWNIGARPVGGKHLVIDLDVKDGRDGIAAYEAIGGEIAGLVVQTPSGGRHIYLTGTDTRNTASKLAPGVDTRGSRGYVVAPGSTIDGKPYVIVQDGPLRPVPPSILARLPRPEDRPRTIRTHATESDLPQNVARATQVARSAEPAMTGTWHDCGYRLGCEMARIGLSPEKAVEVLAQHWVPRGSGFKSEAQFERDVLGGYHDAVRDGEHGLAALPPAETVFGGVNIPDLPSETPIMAETGTGAGWPEPIDFRTTDHAAPVLQAYHIPEALWPFVSDTAARMGVDPASVALCAIVACASVMSDDWKIQPKRMDSDWTENPRLWGAIVGDPSVMKSPVISAATRPIEKLDAEARRRHDQAMQLWRAEELQAKADKVVPPPQPKLDRYLIEACTPEALSEVLRDDPDAKMRAPAKKVLSRHDEMGEFFGNLDRYATGGRGGGDRGTYLRLYNGGRHVIDRVSRGSFAVPNWSACFLGGVQPEPIQRIAREAADDGLLQRFIYCVPDSPGEGVDRAPDRLAAQRYEELFPALVGLHSAALMGAEPVALAEGAHRHRQEIDTLARAMMAMPDTSNRLKAVFGKWPGLFARLCLTFHLIELADRTARGAMDPMPYRVPESIARMAADYLREIVLPNLLRAETLMFRTDQTRHAQWLSDFILSRKLHRITVRDVMRSYRAFRAPEARRELAGVMGGLMAAGWLEADAPTGSQGVTSWTVNPAVHEKFADRAKSEEVRRQAERQKVRQAVSAGRK